VTGQNVTQNITRRRFLHGSAALTTAVAFSTQMTASDSSANKPIRLGVASYSFRKFGPPDVIQFMKRLDTPYLNVKAAGIPLIVAGPTPETLPRLERFAKEYDIKIAIHNHGPEDKYFPSPLEAMKAIKGMDRRIGICVDVGHTARTGTDVPTAIQEVGPRLYDVHMKDLRFADGQWTQVAVGDGDLPVPNIFSSLVAVKYAGYVDLEYEIDENDPMPGMIKSFAYMRGVLAGMALPS